MLFRSERASQAARDAPRSTNGGIQDVTFQLGLQPRTGRRAVPPGADGNAPSLQFEAVDVHGHTLGLGFPDPPCDGLIGLIAAVDVMVARADDHPGHLPEPLEIFPDHQDLDAGIEGGSEVEQVAAEDDGVVAGRMVEQPVKLLDRKSTRLNSSH